MLHGTTSRIGEDAAPAGPVGPGATGRAALILVALASLLLPTLASAPRAVGAQELPLRRTVPSGTSACPEPGPVPEPGPDERDQALELGSSASRAVILGDLDRARDLLERATQLDPRSASLAYRYARVQEDRGEVASALDGYCRAVALAPDGPDAADARGRIETLGRDARRALPNRAVALFRTALARADDGDLTSALEALDEVVELAPEWADAHYNRGVLRARADRRDEARSDLRRYLELRPGAPDAMAVSERIGQLDQPTPRPVESAGAGAGTTLALGLFPGGGHFHSGRSVAGLTVLTLAGGAAAAGLLIEDVEVRCLADPVDGSTCPPDQVADETRTRPYLGTGLGLAAAITVLGALEAFLHVRGRDAPWEVDTSPPPSSRTRMVGPRVEPRPGGGVDVHLLRIRH